MIGAPQQQLPAGTAVDRRQALVYYDLAAKRGSRVARINAAFLRSPDYDQLPARAGASGSQDAEFRRFQCNGAGGQFNGTSCYAPGTNTTIPP